MTIPEDDESLERELFARRERALVSPPVPRLENVLRAVSPPRRMARTCRSAQGPLFAFAACAASVALIVPRLHLFAAVSPEATIRPDLVMTSVQPAAATSDLVSSVRSSVRASAVSSSPDTETCGGEEEQDGTLACSLASASTNDDTSSSCEDLVSSSSP